MSDWVFTVRVVLSLHELDGLLGLADGAGGDAAEFEAGAVDLAGDELLPAVVEGLVLEAVADEALGCESFGCKNIK